MLCYYSQRRPPQCKSNLKFQHHEFQTPMTSGTRTKFQIQFNFLRPFLPRSQKLILYLHILTLS